MANIIRYTVYSRHGHVDISAVCRKRNPPYRKIWPLVHLPIILSELAHRKVLNTSNLVYTMLLVQGRISQKNMAFYTPIGCVRLARYCGKMYSRHIFSVRQKRYGVLTVFFMLSLACRADSEMISKASGKKVDRNYLLLVKEKIKCLVLYYENKLYATTATTTSFITKIKLNVQHRYINTKEVTFTQNN